jgi:type I restriction enzyme S subunit
MSFTSYHEYKNVGVKWLGQIPSSWDIKRFKQVFDERDERSIDGSQTLLSVSAYTGVSPRSEIRDQDEHISRSETLEGYKVCYPNDLVINIMLAWNRGLGVSNYYGIVSPAYCVFKIIDGSEPDFLDYLVRTDEYTGYFKAFSSGVIDSRLRIYPDTLGALYIGLPDKVEQKIIAEFLNYETAKIDNLIVQQEKLIELLKEKRQSVISHTVTKGLKTNVKMKDSGVAWLGEIPEHWVVRAIKHIVSTPVTDGPHETPEFIDEGVPFVSAEAVSSGEVDFTKIRGYISEECHKRYSSKYLPKKGDIFMVKSGATTGITAIVETDQEFNIWSPLAVIRCNRESNPYYVLNFMRSLNFQEAVALNWNFGTQQNIGMGVIENLLCPVPSLDEQKAIADYLTSFTKQFNTLIAEANSAIELFKERRSALISAAVTGQIDVRNYQTKEFQ